LRIAKTWLPTITSASRIRPRRRNPAANPQWTSSALGAMCLAEILDQPGGDHESEDQPDDDDEQRRLEEIVVEPLPLRVEEDDAVRLEDPPHDPTENRERAEDLDTEL